MLRRKVAELPEKRLALVQHHMEEGAKRAKSYIGTERPDWAPLSPNTLNGFYSPDAGWIEGKIKLGYTGHVSDTDPLLREGHLRDSYVGEAEMEGRTIVGVIGSHSEISKDQELGTSRIPPRPVSPPAMIEELPLLCEGLALELANIFSSRP